MRKSITGSVILVIGGAGFIGSHLVDRLINEGAAKIIIVDNLFLGNLKNIGSAIASGAVFIRDDAENDGTIEYIIDKYKPEIIFNCATKALNYSFDNPLNAYMTNVNTIRHLLELQRKDKFKVLCHFSTSEVYGSAVYEPMDESHPFRPTTTYAAGKAAADVMLGSYVSQYGIDAFIVRPFNNYGPRQNYEGALAGVIPATVRRILCGGTPIVYGTGQQSRDFIYVLDTVDAVIKLYDKLPKGEAVNISVNRQITIESLVSQICDCMGYTGKIERLPTRTADVKCHNASNEKLKNLISFTPMPFIDGLAKTIDWYKEVIK